MKKKIIPLIQASVVEPFFRVARVSGVSIEQALATVGLPARMLHDQNLIVPEVPVWELIQLLAQMTAKPLLGLEAAYSLAHQDIKSLKPLLAGCVNLEQLLKRFCVIAPILSNVNEYTLEEDGELIWFKQQGPRFMADYSQIELFEIVGMMQLVQLAAGKRWRPLKIHFSFNASPEIKHAEQLNPSKIRFSRRCPAIAIPRSLLAHKLRRFGKSPDPKPSLPPNNLKDQILFVLSTYGGMRHGEAMITDISGMTMRTLQRTLERQGTSYSEILEQARFEKAQFLLSETNTRQLDISLILGYSNASAFSREFKRWSGVSPREFRCSSHSLGQTRAVN